MTPPLKPNHDCEDDNREVVFNKTMHGKSAHARGGFAAMLSKGSRAKRATINRVCGYFKHWDGKSASEETLEQRTERIADYVALTNRYYDLATDMYEHGWGQSFHFCRFSKGESFRQAIIRHEHYLAESIEIHKKMKILDVGCGVGGPAREIAKFTGATVTGLNINGYQIERATHYANEAGLSDQVKFVQGDFMQIPFDNNTFDAVYAMDATVHAPTLKGVYSEIFRVLKPGGTFGVYEWVMTDKYDDKNPHHREIRFGIEQGNGISNINNISVAVHDMKSSGFELLRNEDLAYCMGPLRWYWPISGKVRYIQSPRDVFTIMRMSMTRVGRTIIHNLVGLLESLRLLPPRTKKTADCLALAADSLVAGGREQLFTPMYLMVSRKPLASSH